MNKKGFKFKPFSIKQRRLLNWWRNGSPYKDKEIIIADGAIRSGKTIAMICSFLLWSQTEHDNETFIIAGRSIGALKRNVINPMLQILRAWGWSYYYHRSENYIIIGNNTYYMFGASTEASQDVIQGLTAAGALADEIALFPKSFVDQMIGRCSVEGFKIFMNCNPQGPFHYIKEEYIDLVDERSIYHIHFVMEDNLTLSKAMLESYKNRHRGVFYQRYILGLWVMAEGVIYDMFDEEEHTVETKDRPYSKYYVSKDYGTQNPTAFGLWGLHDGVWYKVKEYHHSGRESNRQKTDTEYADDYEEFIGDLKISGIILDPSAASYKAELRKRGHHVIDGDNDVLDGIRNVGTALVEGMIKYNDCCTNTFKEFNSYVWDEKAALRGEDKPLKQSDHHLDADRYFVNTILFREKTPFFTSASSREV